MRVLDLLWQRRYNFVHPHLGRGPQALISPDSSAAQVGRILLHVLAHCAKHFHGLSELSVL